MPDDFIDLRSINWSQGMFLTPDHFLRQERYFDSALLWVLKHAMSNAGLVGGGARIEAAERGAARFDPIVAMDDGGETVKITVTQCRGMTASGAIIDVEPARNLTATFTKKELETVMEFGVYVVARPHDKEPDEGVEDPINPQLQVARRLRYRISIDPQADDAPWSLLLDRFRRADRGLRFERVSGFIPPCAFMSAHSTLMGAYRQLNERVAVMADHYSALHRAVVDYIGMARARQLNIDQDLETLTFVSRMVVALEECTYRILDPIQPPRPFFQRMNQLIRSAALFLSLSPPTREYFRLLGDIGENDFVSMLEQEAATLEKGRRGLLDDDLSAEAQKVMRALDRLNQLEQALEGKYMDYRISPSLENINFVFDQTQGEPVLYKTVARPMRPQGDGQELTFVFAPLRLEAREQYRLILVGQPQATFRSGDSLTVQLHINRGGGLSQRPDFRTTHYQVDGQKNFAVDFSAPEDVVTINDVRASLQSSQPIRSAILYVRARLIAKPVLTPRGDGFRPGGEHRGSFVQRDEPPVGPPAPPPRPAPRPRGDEPRQVDPSGPADLGGRRSRIKNPEER